MHRQNSFLNSPRPGQNDRHFVDDIFKCIFTNRRFWISIRIPLKFVPRGPLDNTSALVHVMHWRRTDDKTLPEPMPTHFTHACMRYWGEIELMPSLNQVTRKSPYFLSQNISLHRHRYRKNGVVDKKKSKTEKPHVLGVLDMNYNLFRQNSYQKIGHSGELPFLTTRSLENDTTLDRPTSEITKTDQAWPFLLNLLHGTVHHPTKIWKF